MWEDNDAEDGDEDDDDEEEGLAGQLLSDLIASNKYGTTNSSWISSLIFSNIFLLLSNSTYVNSCCFFVLQMMIIMRTMRKMIQMH